MFVCPKNIAVVTLTQPEQKLVKYFSTLRYEMSRSKNIPDRIKNIEMAKRCDLHGAIGEYASCKYLNADFNTKIEEGTDYGVDLIHQGITIDTKTTTYINGDLYFNDKKKFRAEMANLAFLNENDLSTVYLLGYIWKAEFLANASQKIINSETKWAVDQTKLGPITDLLDIQLLFNKLRSPSL